MSSPSRRVPRGQMTDMSRSYQREGTFCLNILTERHARVEVVEQALVCFSYGFGSLSVPKFSGEGYADGCGKKTQADSSLAKDARRCGAVLSPRPRSQDTG